MTQRSTPPHPDGSLSTAEEQVLDAMSTDLHRAWFVGDVVERMGAPNPYRTGWRAAASLLLRPFGTGRRQAGIQTALLLLASRGVISGRPATREDLRASPAVSRLWRLLDGDPEGEQFLSLMKVYEVRGEGRQAPARTAVTVRRPFGTPVLGRV